jgi:hypothetical protein
MVFAGDCLSRYKCHYIALALGERTRFASAQAETRASAIQKRDLPCTWEIAFWN